MLGGNKDWVVTQGEILAGLFAGDGYAVRLTSTRPNRILRLADTLVSLVAWRRQIDLVLLAVFSGPAFWMADVSSLLAKRLGKPILSILRGGNLPDYAARHPQRIRRVFGRSAALVAPSGYLAHTFRDWGVELEVIPNVLAIERYPYRLRLNLRPNLLWMRTFEEAYHPEMAVHVLKEVQKNHPQARLTMGGQDRGLLETVKKLAVRYGLEDSLRFSGFLDLAGKQREFPIHDIFLNTNRVDNMPVSVLEAAAFGLPVVATAVGGIPYLLTHEETALLVPDESIPEMAAAVNRLVREPDLAARLSAQGRCLAEASAWPAVKSAWERVFTRVL
jgi:glycosyltransferase involved in cell wall biosynthesis